MTIEEIKEEEGPPSQVESEITTKPRRIAVFVEPSPFAYVSGYKHPFPNFIKYMREMGDEVGTLIRDEKDSSLVSPLLLSPMAVIIFSKVLDSNEAPETGVFQMKDNPPDQAADVEVPRPSCPTGGGGDGEFRIPLTSIHDQDHQSPTVNRILDSSNITRLMFNAAIVVMCPQLISLIQLKFQNGKHSAFKSHGPFITMSAVALTIAAITSGLLFYMDNKKDNQIKKRIGLIGYMILKTVFYFFGILTPLSLLMVLFIRDEDHHWVGYSMVSVFFVAVIVWNVFFGYIMLRRKNDSMTRSRV